MNTLGEAAFYPLLVAQVIPIFGVLYLYKFVL